MKKEFDGSDLLAVICSVLLPPLGVFMKVGFESHFWINLLLTVFGFYILGIVHALYVNLK